ncbi:MAG: polysaccharide deacetylase family protein [Syntrophobacteraceae bacterium]
MRRLAEAKFICVYYHVVSNEHLPHIRHLYRYKTVKEFEQDIEFILKHYTPITITMLLDWLNGDKEIPNDSILITFDDGLREIGDIVAPILWGKGVPATFFVSSGFLDNAALCYDHKISLIIDYVLQRGSDSFKAYFKDKFGVSIKETNEMINILRFPDQNVLDVLDKLAEIAGIDYKDYLNGKRPYLSATEITALIEKGFSIGGHGVAHRPYSELDFQTQVEETAQCMLVLEEKFGIKHKVFSFPHGAGGVSSQLLTLLNYENIAQVTFGTGGFMDTYHPRHFERLSLENPLMPAASGISLGYGKRLLKNIIRG